MRTRYLLAYYQAAWDVGEDKRILDPPLLRLEGEAYHAYLSVLLHLYTLDVAEDANVRLQEVRHVGGCGVAGCAACRGAVWRLLSVAMPAKPSPAKRRADGSTRGVVCT